MNRWKKAAWLLSAAGIISLASFGIYNTVNAIGDLNQPQTAGYISAETSAASNNPATGSGCSPYGCAACSVCTRLPYQQDIEVIPGTALQYE